MIDEIQSLETATGQNVPLSGGLGENEIKAYAESVIAKGVASVDSEILSLETSIGITKVKLRAWEEIHTKLIALERERKLLLVMKQVYEASVKSLKMQIKELQKNP